MTQVLSSKDLRKSLGALSYEYEQKLPNSEELRNSFYKLYPNKNYEIIDKHPKDMHDNWDEITKNIKDFPKNRDEFLFVNTYSSSINNDSSYNDIDTLFYYTIIWKSGDDYVYIEPYESTDYCGSSWVTCDFWSLNNAPAKINFLKFTNVHERLIIDVCEKFGYNNIIQYIKNNE